MQIIIHTALCNTSCLLCWLWMYAYRLRCSYKFENSKASVKLRHRPNVQWFLNKHCYAESYNAFNKTHMKYNENPHKIIHCCLMP